MFSNLQLITIVRALEVIFCYEISPIYVKQKNIPLDLEQARQVFEQCDTEDLRRELHKLKNTVPNYTQSLEFKNIPVNMVFPFSILSCLRRKSLPWIL